MNETADLMDFHVKYKRINRTQYGMSGSVEFTSLDGIESELLIFHQAKGGNRFVLTPYKLPRGAICSSLNQDYRKYLMADLHLYSNFPYSEDTMEDICPQFENTKFELKDFIMTKATIPESMEYGTYKALAFMYKGDDLMNGLEFNLRLF